MSDLQAELFGPKASARTEAEPKTQELPELPMGWVWARVEEVYKLVGGGTPTTKRPEYWQGNIPWVTSADISEDGYVNPRKYITAKAVEDSATSLVPEGSIIVATRVGLGKVAVAPFEICFSQDCQALVGGDGVLDSKYALYFLSVEAQRFKWISRGTTIAGITKKQLAELPLKVPPLREQRRIVEKLEELLSDLDAGVATLRQALAKLKRYRQAVLKAAVEGELSREWREANKHRLEPASKLLERILAERRSKSSGDKKYREPEPPNTSELPELPEGWVWTKFGQIFNVFVGSTPSRKEPSFWGGHIPWVSSGEVAFCRIKQTKESITTEGLNSSSTKVHPVGTVMLGMIGEGKTRGQAAILDIAAAHNQNTAAIRVSETPIPPEYVYYYLEYRYLETRRVGAGNNQQALNKALVEDFVLPLPPLDELAIIVREIDRRLSEADRLEATLQANLKRAERLRQAILKKAFSGELVPQDPNDEPASVLLERIRASRAQAPKKGKRKQ